MYQRTAVLLPLRRYLCVLVEVRKNLKSERFPHRDKITLIEGEASVVLAELAEAKGKI